MTLNWYLVHIIQGEYAHSQAKINKAQQNNSNLQANRSILRLCRRSREEGHFQKNQKSK